MFSGLAPHWHYGVLVVAAFAAGVINAMAGGGSFLSFPAMLALGVPPIEANATNTVALWPGQLTSLFTLHDDVRRDLLPVVLITSLIGGIAGAEVLLHTPQRTFVHLIPWLLLGGAVIFGVSGHISRWLGRRTAGHAPMASTQVPGESFDRPIPAVPLALALLPICFYVGYFGAGGGFLIMTVLALFGLEDMHKLNALKVVTAATANFCAIVTFIFSGRIVWHYCLVAMVAAAVGGYIGARNARAMNPSVLRAVVVITGVVIAGYFFWREY